MSNTILPNAISLVTMTEDELHEELCKDIYNRPNSHEMIRRLVKLCSYCNERAYDAEECAKRLKLTLRAVRSYVDEMCPGPNEDW